MKEGIFIEINGITINDNDLDIKYVRSAGAGGQNVNKVASKAVVHWHFEQCSLPLAIKERFRARYASRITSNGDVVITSDRYRDQPRNLADALAKLSIMIASVIKPPTPRRKTKPSKGSVERRLKAKKIQSERKKNRSSY